MEEICLSPMTKATIPIEISKQESDNTKTPPKFSITQWSHTGLRRIIVKWSSVLFRATDDEIRRFPRAFHDNDGDLLFHQRWGVLKCLHVPFNHDNDGG